MWRVQIIRVPWRATLEAIDVDAAPAKFQITTQGDIRSTRGDHFNLRVAQSYDVTQIQP